MSWTISIRGEVSTQVTLSAIDQRVNKAKPELPTLWANAERDYIP